jgi:hypothetical protein
LDAASKRDLACHNPLQPPTPPPLPAPSCAPPPQPGKSGSLLLGPAAAPLAAPANCAAQFQNAVERTQWRGVAVTATGEHVAAGVASKEGHHKIFLWNRTNGKLERILEGGAAGVGGLGSAACAEGAA